MASCTMLDNQGPGEPTKAQLINWIETSPPGEYSMFETAFANGGLHFIGNVERDRWRRSTITGDTIAISTGQLGVPPGSTYAVPWADKVLVHSDGPDLGTGPALVFDAEGERPVTICQPGSRCGQGAMRPTMAGVLIVAATIPIYEGKPYSVRWLGDEAAEDVFVAEPVDMDNDFIMAVTSDDTSVFGCYFTGATYDGEATLVPFRFKHADPSGTFRTGTSFSFDLGPRFPSLTRSLGHVEAGRYEVQLFLGTSRLEVELDVETLSIQSRTVHEIEDPRIDSSISPAYANGDPSSLQATSPAAVYRVEHDRTDTYYRLQLGADALLWTENLAQIELPQSTDMADQVPFSGGSFKFVGSQNGSNYFFNAFWLVEVDTDGRTQRSWTVFADRQSANLNSTRIWGARMFGDVITLKGILDVNTAMEVVHVAQVSI